MRTSELKAALQGGQFDARLTYIYGAAALDAQKARYTSAVEEFEKLYGRRSDKKRKLYNGMIPCNLYQFFKPKNDKTK